MENQECDLQDTSQQDQQDLSTDKHSRFNLRKLNIPPLKRDHSRSLDYTLQYQKANNKGYKQEILDPQLQNIDLARPNNNPSSPINLTPSRSRKASILNEYDTISRNNALEQSQNNPQSSLDQRREKRRKFNLRENLSPQQLQMTGDYMHGQHAEQDSKTSGRWSREEHEKFIEAMSLYGRDWKKVEQHIGTRSGAQIRSHAQKFFNRIEKELGQDVDTYIQSKAQSLFKRGVPTFNHDESHDVQMRKGSLMVNETCPQFSRDRSISHTFGVQFNPINAYKRDDDDSKEELSKDIEGKATSSKHLLNSNISKQNVMEKIQQSKSKFVQQQPKETPLQKVLKESFNNYTSPAKQELIQGIEGKLNEIIQEKNQVASELIKNYSEILNNPITIEEFLNKYKNIHQQIQATYFNQLKDQQLSITPEQYEIVLSTFIEIQNNLQLLTQIQMFVGLSLAYRHDQSSLSVSPDTKPPQIVYHSPPSAPQHKSHNESSLDHHQSPADSISRLLQQYATSNKRKLSDFVERGSHPNEDSLRKRDLKFSEKVNEGVGFKPLRVPDSAFHALAATSCFQPTSKGSMESIRKLRAASTSNESGILLHEKASSPDQNKQRSEEKQPLGSTEKKMNNEYQVYVHHVGEITQE